MNRNTTIAALFCAFAAVVDLSSQIRAELKPEDLYSNVTPSMVTLDVETLEGKHFVGSAFLAVNKGFAVTAWHVVHDARRISARFSDQQSVTEVNLIDKNPTFDLALLKVEGGGRPRIPLSSDVPRIGSRVYLLGSPRGLDFSIREGLISQVRDVDGIRYYQLSCPISPGDSGGPVLNDRGEAVGVVSWRKADAENVGFAIPSLAAFKLNSALPITPWGQSKLGTLATVTSESLPISVGRSDLKAERETPDVIRSFDAFQRFLADRAGETVDITVEKSGRRTQFQIEIPKSAAK